MKHLMLAIVGSLFLLAHAQDLPISKHPFGLIATDPLLDSLGMELHMPMASESGLVQTLNFGGGFMLTHLDPISAAFVEYAKNAQDTLLDIGSAFGVTTLPALKNSSYSVIANDIGSDNLLILRNQTNDADRSRLYLNNQRFPDQLDLPDSSLSAVIACRVFHFLRGEEIESGLDKIYRWLIPGGKVFIVTSTPYQGNLKEFVSIYEQRWADHNFWPGYVEDYAMHAPGISHNLYPFLHVMDERPLRRALEDAGFIIEKIEIIDRRTTIPKTSLDGREGIGIIAHKPS